MILPKANNAKINNKIGRHILNNYPKVSSNRLATKFSISRSTILKFLKINKIKIISKGFYKKHKKALNRKLPDLEIMKYDYFIKNMNQNQMGIKYQCNPRCISQEFKKNNIKLRSITDVRSITFLGHSHINEYGYVRQSVPLEDRHLFSTKNKTLALQHRYVVSKHLNRILLPTETIDHKNGNRQDNRIQNLELKPTAHGPGQDVHHTLHRSIDDILRLGNEYLTGKHGNVKMNAKYKKQLKQMLGK